MKLDPHNIQARVEHVIQAEQKKTKFLDNRDFIPGLKIWKFKIETGEVLPVVMDEVTPELLQSPPPILQALNKTHHISLHAKVITEEGYLYVQALNEDSAARKFYRMIGIKIPKIKQLRKSKQQK